MVVDNAAPAIYCDGYQGVWVTNSTVKINLVEERFNPENPSEIVRHQVGKLIMPVNVFIGTVESLAKVAQEMKESLESYRIKDGK